MTVTAKTRREVTQRDQGKCIVATFGVIPGALGPCSGPLTMQHTVGRGMGGSKLFDTADLLILMCNQHNVLMTASALAQAIGKARGWVKDRNAKRDPRQTPVEYGDGWHRLVGTGRVSVPTADALEYMFLIGARKVA